MSRYPYWGILVYLTLVGCIPLPPDPDPELPPETQEGLNTLGMTVNGYVFEARGGSNNNPHLDVWQWDNTIKIQGWDYVDDNSFILNLRFNDNPFNYDSTLFYFWSSNQLVVSGEVVMNNPSIGSVAVIPNDSSKIFISHASESTRILSGSFEIDLVTDFANGDTIKIRKGRFDVIVH